MKKTIIAILAFALAAASCHKPEFIESNADRQGLTSITAIFTSGEYVNQELAKLTVDEQMYEEGRFVIPIPWYYPATSDDVTTFYQTRLRVQAELQPNFRIDPPLGILDLTEENWFTFTDPTGASRQICITGERVHSSECELISFMLSEMMISGVIYKDQDRILIPYMGDLSSVAVAGQVSPHATLTKIGGKKYSDKTYYDLSGGATVTVLADDQKTEHVYKVEQGIPELLDMGLNASSLTPLFNVDPVTMMGLPPYNQLAYVSLASIENNLVICTGDGSAPMYVNRFTGAKLGTVNLGAAKADVVTNDEKEHLLIANFVEGGTSAGDISIYVSSSVKSTPELLYTFTNPVSEPLGHRMKTIGDVKGDAVIVFTAEGIEGVTTTAKAVVLTVKGGRVTGEPKVEDFAGLGFGWGPAPVAFATVVPASLTPSADGYFVDWYDGNADVSIADADSGADAYILHHVDAKGRDNRAALVGNWANNPNCMDCKTFNGSRYLTLFVVSHFPQWGTAPRLYLYDVTDPDSATELFSNRSIEWYQDGTYDGAIGAAGDVVLCPSADGYRMYVYYYDHHAQAIGGYVVDCIKI